MKKKRLLSILIIAMVFITIVPFSSYAASSKSTAAKYSSLFTKKWYTPLQREYKKIYDDYNTYPSEDERQCRWLYDALCDAFRKSRGDAPDRTTEYVLPAKIFVGYHFTYSSDGTYSFKKKDKSAYTAKDIESFIIKDSGEFYPFSEFYNNCLTESTTWGWQYDWLVTCSDYMRNYASKSFFPEITGQMKIIANKDFNRLSGAMKVYAIDKSGYFTCRSSRKGTYGMLYNNKAEGSTNKLDTKKRLKNLYLNKAQGVCHDYSNYEKTYFNSIGLKAWYRSSSKIGHAWTVIKTKNTKGKTLWIPFDYGIGPAENLSVSKKQKKYISTEKKRYKLYLKGISGAPSYKNFTDEDFN